MTRQMLLTVFIILGVSCGVVAEPGRLSDCMMDMMGARGTCTGVCFMEYLITKGNSVLDGIQTCVMGHIEIFSQGFTENMEYNDIYKLIFENNDKLCSLVPAIIQCVTSKMDDPPPNDKCGLGKDFMGNMRKFVESHLGCSGDKQQNWIKCVANPDFINKLADESNWPKCMTDLINNDFIQGMISEGGDDAESIMTKIRNSRSELCSLVDKATTCFIQEAQPHCGDIPLDYILNDQIKGLTEVMGCENPQKYDLMPCLMDYNWLTVTIPQKCPMDDMITEFSGMNINLDPNDISAMLSAILQPHSAICELEKFLDCIGEAIEERTACSNDGFTYNAYKSIVEPAKDYMDYNKMCPTKNYPEQGVIKTCKCAGGSDFKYGGEVSQCPAVNSFSLRRCTELVTTGSGYSLHTWYPAWWTAMATLLAVISLLGNP